MSKIIAGATTPRCFVVMILAVLALSGPTHAPAQGTGEWQTINTEFGETRHEGASAQAGEAFYVLGGRESDAVRIYDPFDGGDGSWATGASSPIQLHHFQAVELDGLIYAIGAMTGPYPEEDPVENVYIYDPLADTWITGPPLPSDRLRGSGGAVVHNGLIYWISGNTNGHVGPVTAMMDVYDPAAGSFTPLSDIPHPRDHFFATLYQDSIYVIGGRRTGEVSPFEPTVPEIDVYDVAADAWQTLPADTHLTPPRAAAATDRVGDEIIIAGGESGSQDTAHAETQAFNPATGQWRDLADMLTPRHAAQAIVSNEGFYVAAGSPVRGGPGGAVLDTEALFLDGETMPTGTPITAGTLSAPASVMFDSASQTVPISHEGGNQAVVITDIQISGDAAFSLTEALPGPVSLAPGAGREVAIDYSGEFAGETAELAITDSKGQITTVALEADDGNGDPAPIAFSSQTITQLDGPTQLEFGPDGRLYVSELKGLIHAFTIERDDSTGDYSIVDTEVIDLIQTIPNHNDDGTPFSSDQRNVTGMVTAGTPDNPVLYVASSDPRIDDPQVDTNSGVLSRLSWTGSEWVKDDLVRSLPRSAHDHLPNGLALDADSGILYLAQGGHTNMGAPSFSFEDVPEYALSAAILSIDLDAIGDQTYDIPTLKGEVFGGQTGDNQAMLVAGGPVQVHSPGYRNAYDVLLTAAGRLYTFDNASNSGWGGLPIGEGPAGDCTNQSNESDSATYGDNFHLITGPGYYGGHPNPTRANRSNTFDGLSPIPDGFENPVECDFLIPAVEDGALSEYGASTNGLAEYTATNFDGQMVGDIITTTWDGKALRLVLNGSGDEVIEQSDLFTGMNGPLGITAQSDLGPFPGTIWIGQFFNGDLTVFEPQDFSECDPDALDPDDTSPNGYTYGDLMDNGLDPCNPSQVPPDFDENFVSDLNDVDIDGDGIANASDLFDFDADNGRGNALPHLVDWSSEHIGTLGGMSVYNAPGFSGLMAHPDNPVSVFDQFDADHLVPGGATGIFTVEQVTTGDAQQNTQENAFHFGVDVDNDSAVFTAQARIMSPFAGTTPQDNQSMGLLIGNGDQDNYIKLVTHANGGAGGLLLASEVQGDFDGEQVGAAILEAEYVDLYLVVDPAASSVHASYVIANDGEHGPRTAVGEPLPLPAGWLNDATNGPAIGIISTSSGAEPFPASWGFVEVYEGTGDDFPVPGEGQLGADPAALDFPDTLVDETTVQTVTLSNTGDAELEITNAAITGDNVFTHDLAVPQTLQPGATQDFSVSFSPDDTTGFEADLTLSHDGSNSPLQISMTGNGTESGPAPISLDLQLDATPTPAIAGDTLDYTLTVANLSDTQADNVSLEITLPPATTLLGTAGCEQDPAGHPACTVGQLPANGSSDVTVSVEVASNAAGSLQFEASASADNLAEAVSAEITTPLALVSDLALSMTGDSVPVDEQTMSLAYVIAVSNAGPSDALTAQVVTELASGLDNIEWTCEADAAASCTASGQGAIDDLADLPAGTSVTYLVEATASSGLIDEAITSFAEVTPSGENSDPNLANNSDSATIGDRIFHDSFEAIPE